MSFTYKCSNCGHNDIVHTVYEHVPAVKREWAWTCLKCGHKITEGHVKEIARRENK